MLIESFNTAVRGRKDLQDLHAPFVGEIPLATQRKGKRRVAREVSDNRVVVKSGSRSIMNEAFRVVRTNLEFILGFDGGHHVVMLSSMKSRQRQDLHLRQPLDRSCHQRQESNSR